jgi:hypothetical protein
MAVVKIDGGDGVQPDMGAFFGPEHVDQLMRPALQFAWMSLPAERKTLDAWEAQARRIFERAVRDFREDRAAFGQPT